MPVTAIYDLISSRFIDGREEIPIVGIFINSLEDDINPKYFRFLQFVWKL